MRGDLVFETLGGVDIRFIAEADPEGAAVSGGVIVGGAAKKPKGHRPLGGWVAAAVCAIVALGVYLGAMWLGQGEWESPATTGEGTAETVETVETTVTDTGETVEETVTDPEPQPEPYAFENQHFVVEQIGGQYYLNFYSGNRENGIGYITYTDFDSMEAMFNAIYHGELTEKQLLDIWLFAKKDEDGYLIMDLWDMAEPVIPEGGEFVKVSWSGNEYVPYYTHPAFAKAISMNIDQRTESDGWAKREAYRKSKDGYPKTDVTVDGIPAVATTQITETVTYIHLYLSIEDEANDRELYIYAQYKTAEVADPQSIVSTQAPYRLDVVGLQGDKRFSIIEWNSDDGTALPILTEDVLLSFAVKPFAAPEKEDYPQLTLDDPYHIEKIDGIHYLVFPEWDGVRPKVALPEDHQLYSPIYESAAAMVEKIRSHRLSRYEIRYYKLMADENGRVRLPDLNTHLVPVVTNKYFIAADRFYFTTDGQYYGTNSRARVEFDQFGFAVMSKEAWEASYAEELNREPHNILSEVTVLEGTCNGLPCTFYAYIRDHQRNGEEETVRCHVVAKSGEERLEMFFTTTEVWFFDLVEGFDLTFKDDYDQTFENLVIFGVKEGRYYRYNFGTYLYGNQVIPNQNIFTEFDVKVVELMS